MASLNNPARESIKEVIKEDRFATYAVRFDINDKGEDIYNLDSFVNALMYELSDFAHGGAYWAKVTPSNPTAAISEAAKALYRIPEFKKIQEMYVKGESLSDEVDDQILRKGEFGELILFFLLKNFQNAIPLLSKIYFKDTDNATVHGFDAVHYHEDTKSIWLGESKCYEDGKSGLRALVSDIKEHIAGEYLKREFVLISKKFKLATDIEDGKRNEILDILNTENSLANKLSSITIPLLCTFTSKSFIDFTKETDEFVAAYQEEMRALKVYFEEKNDHPLKDRLNILLLLMPVKSKQELVAALHARLAAAQRFLI